VKSWRFSRHQGFGIQALPKDDLGVGASPLVHFMVVPYQPRAEYWPLEISVLTFIMYPYLVEISVLATNT